MLFEKALVNYVPLRQCFLLASHVSPRHTLQMLELCQQLLTHSKLVQASHLSQLVYNNQNRGLAAVFLGYLSDAVHCRIIPTVVRDCSRLKESSWLLI